MADEIPPIEGKMSATQNFTFSQLDQGQTRATRWQKSLFVVGIVATLLIFGSFVWMTVWQVNTVQHSIGNAPELHDSVITTLYSADLDADQRLTGGLFHLENEIIKKRYHNANVLLRGQIYIKYLGFLTGMILSILGAMFVLGKYREQPFTANAKSERAAHFNFSFQSTSPGLLLTFAGVIILMTTLLNKSELAVKDQPVYLRGNVSNEEQMEEPEHQENNRPGFLDSFPPYKR